MAGVVGTAGRLQALCAAVAGMGLKEAGVGGRGRVDGALAGPAQLQQPHHPGARAECLPATMPTPTPTHTAPMSMPAVKLPPLSFCTVLQAADTGQAGLCCQVVSRMG